MLRVKGCRDYTVKHTTENVEGVFFRGGGWGFQKISKTRDRRGKGWGRNHAKDFSFSTTGAENSEKTEGGEKRKIYPQDGSEARVSKGKQSGIRARRKEKVTNKRQEKERRDVGGVWKKRESVNR